MDNKEKWKIIDSAKEGIDFKDLNQQRRIEIDFFLAWGLSNPYLKKGISKDELVKYTKGRLEFWIEHYSFLEKIQKEKKKLKPCWSEGQEKYSDRKWKEHRILEGTPKRKWENLYNAFPFLSKKTVAKNFTPNIEAISSAKYQKKFYVKDYPLLAAYIDATPLSELEKAFLKSELLNDSKPLWRILVMSGKGEWDKEGHFHNQTELTKRQRKRFREEIKKKWGFLDKGFLRGGKK